MLCRAAILANDLNDPNDIVIEFFQFLCGYPPLRMVIATHFLDFVAAHKRATDREASDISNTIVFDIPPASDLRCVSFIRDWIENRLRR